MKFQKLAYIPLVILLLLLLYYLPEIQQQYVLLSSQGKIFDFLLFYGLPISIVYIFSIILIWITERK